MEGARSLPRRQVTGDYSDWRTSELFVIGVRQSFFFAGTPVLEEELFPLRKDTNDSTMKHP